MPAKKPPRLGEPKVSVIIPVFRDWDDAYVCVEALLQQTYKGEFEILIINNGAETEAPAQLGDNEKVKLLHEPKAGSYAARNTAIRVAGGEIFAFTDADCIPAKDWIEQAIAHFQGHPNISRLAGKIELTFRHPTKRSAVELFEQVFAFQQERKVKEEGSAITANLLAKREVFEAIGSFDESLRSGGDSDWGSRAASAGFGIAYAPEVTVFHPARYSWGQLYSKTARLYGGKWQRTHRAGRPMLIVTQKAKVFRSEGSHRLSFSEKLKVLPVIMFVGIVQFFEHFRLLLGGNPRRN